MADPPKIFGPPGLLKTAPGPRFRRFPDATQRALSFDPNENYDRRAHELQWKYRALKEELESIGRSMGDPQGRTVRAVRAGEINRELNDIRGRIDEIARSRGDAGTVEAPPGPIQAASRAALSGLGAGPAMVGGAIGGLADLGMAAGRAFGGAMEERRANALSDLKAARESVGLAPGQNAVEENVNLHAAYRKALEEGRARRAGEREQQRENEMDALTQAPPGTAEALYGERVQEFVGDDNPFVRAIRGVQHGAKTSYSVTGSLVRKLQGEPGLMDALIDRGVVKVNKATQLATFLGIPIAEIVTTKGLAGGAARLAAPGSRLRGGLRALGRWDHESRMRAAGVAVLEELPIAASNSTDPADMLINAAFAGSAGALFNSKKRWSKSVVQRMLRGADDPISGEREVQELGRALGIGQGAGPTPDPTPTPPVSEAGERAKGFADRVLGAYGLAPIAAAGTLLATDGEEGEALAAAGMLGATRGRRRPGLPGPSATRQEMLSFLRRGGPEQIRQLGRRMNIEESQIEGFLRDRAELELEVREARRPEGMGPPREPTPKPEAPVRPAVSGAPLSRADELVEKAVAEGWSDSEARTLIRARLEAPETPGVRASPEAGGQRTVTPRAQLAALDLLRDPEVRRAVSTKVVAGGETYDWSDLKTMFGTASPGVRSILGPQPGETALAMDELVPELGRFVAERGGEGRIDARAVADLDALLRPTLEAKVRKIDDEVEEIMSAVRERKISSGRADARARTREIDEMRRGREAHAEAEGTTVEELYPQRPNRLATGKLTDRDADREARSIAEGTTEDRGSFERRTADEAWETSQREREVREAGEARLRSEMEATQQVEHGGGTMSSLREAKADPRPARIRERNVGRGTDAFWENPADLLAKTLFGRGENPRLALEGKHGHGWGLLSTDAGFEALEGGNFGGLRRIRERFLRIVQENDAYKTPDSQRRAVMVALEEMRRAAVAGQEGAADLRAGTVVGTSDEILQDMLDDVVDLGRQWMPDNKMLADRPHWFAVSVLSELASRQNVARRAQRATNREIRELTPEGIVKEWAGEAQAAGGLGKPAAGVRSGGIDEARQHLGLQRGGKDGKGEWVEEDVPTATRSGESDEDAFDDGFWDFTAEDETVVGGELDPALEAVSKRPETLQEAVEHAYATGRSPADVIMQVDEPLGRYLKGLQEDLDVADVLDHRLLTDADGNPLKLYYTDVWESLDGTPRVQEGPQQVPNQSYSRNPNWYPASEPQTDFLGNLRSEIKSLATEHEFPGFQNAISNLAKVARSLKRSELDRIKAQSPHLDDETAIELAEEALRSGPFVSYQIDALKRVLDDFRAGERPPPKPVSEAQLRKIAQSEREVMNWMRQVGMDLTGRKRVKQELAIFRRSLFPDGRQVPSHKMNSSQAGKWIGHLKKLVRDGGGSGQVKVHSALAATALATQMALGEEDDPAIGLAGVAGITGVGGRAGLFRNMMGIGRKFAKNFWPSTTEAASRAGHALGSGARSVRDELTFASAKRRMNDMIGGMKKVLAQVRQTGGDPGPLEEKLRLLESQNAELVPWAKPLGQGVARTVGWTAAPSAGAAAVASWAYGDDADFLPTALTYSLFGLAAGPGVRGLQRTRMGPSLQTGGRLGGTIEEIMNRDPSTLGDDLAAFRQRWGKGSGNQFVVQKGRDIRAVTGVAMHRYNVHMVALADALGVEKARQAIAKGGWDPSNHMDDAQKQAAKRLLTESTQSLWSRHPDEIARVSGLMRGGPVRLDKEAIELAGEIAAFMLRPFRSVGYTPHIQNPDAVLSDVIALLDAGVPEASVPTILTRWHGLGDSQLVKPDLEPILRDHVPDAATRQVLEDRMENPVASNVSMEMPELASKILGLDETVAAPLVGMRKEVERLGQELIDLGVAAKGEIEIGLGQSGLFLREAPVGKAETPEEFRIRMQEDPEWQIRLNRYKTWVREQGADFDGLADVEIETAAATLKERGLRALNADDASRFYSGPNLGYMKDTQELPGPLRDLLSGDVRTPVQAYRTLLMESANRISKLQLVREFEKIGLVDMTGTNPAMTEAVPTVKALGEREVKTFPELAEALRSYWGGPGEELKTLKDALTVIHTANTFAKGINTAVSARSHVKNVTSHYANFVGAGFPMGGIEKWSSAVRALAHEAGMAQGGADDITERMIRAGVFGEDASQEIVAGLERLRELNVLQGGEVRKTISMGFGAVGQLYAAGDNLPRAVMFMKQRDLVGRAHPTSSPEQLDKIAAQRLRSTMPSFHDVPEAIEVTRRYGGYVTSNWEQLRVASERMSLAMQDIKSGNPTLMRHGFKSVAGQMAWYSAMLALPKAMAEVHGLNDEYRKRIRDGTPPYWKNGLLVPLTDLKRNGRMVVADVSSWLPDGAAFKMLNAAINEDKPLEDKTKDAMGEFASSYIGLSPLGGALVRGVRRGHSAGELGLNLLPFTGEYSPFTPPAFKQIQRVRKGELTGGPMGWALWGAGLPVYNVEIH